MQKFPIYRLGFPRWPSGEFPSLLGGVIFKPQESVFVFTRSFSSEIGSTVFQKKNNFSEFILCCTNFYTVLKTTHICISPSSIHLVSHVMHLSVPIVTRLFFTIHCLLASWVSLPIIIFHFLSLITLLSVVHVSISLSRQRNLFSGKEWFFFKERNSSFSFNLLVPKLLNDPR